LSKFLQLPAWQIHSGGRRQPSVLFPIFLLPLLLLLSGTGFVSGPEQYCVRPTQGQVDPLIGGQVG
jgi:hypothetical protein